MPAGQAASNLSVASDIGYPILNAMEAQLEPQLEEMSLKTYIILKIYYYLRLTTY